MKITLRSALFAAVLGTIAATSSAFAADAPPAPPAPVAGAPLMHVVSLKFKPTATPAQIQAVDQAFVALKQKIPGIQKLTWGTNVSPEKLDKGFTHCFVLTFKSAADRDAYLVHPDHKAFGAMLSPVLEDVMVIDFWGR
jgi:hypothetical protein